MRGGLEGAGQNLLLEHAQKDQARRHRLELGAEWRAVRPLGKGL
jgi:hypothetical protein